MAKTKIYSSKEVAGVLRKARDLMNHGGAHWVQGDEKVFNDELGAHQYCMIGAVREVTGRKTSLYDQTVKILGSKLDPQIMEFYDYGQDEFVKTKDPMLIDSAAAEDAIATFNDASRRTWPEVRSTLTKLSKNLTKRKA